MEEEKQKKRNVRPVEKSKLPGITLVVLSVLVLALLYVGYEYLTDEPGDTSEVTNADPDREVVSLDVYNEPSQVDVNSGNVPVPGGTAPEAKAKTGDSKDTKEAQTPASSSEGVAYTHTVTAGETLFSIATRYNLKVETLKALNPSVTDNAGVKAGQKINVRIKAVHTVGAGDILRVVGNKYGVSVDLIMRANNKARNHAARGEKLVIPFAQKQ